MNRRMFLPSLSIDKWLYIALLIYKELSSYYVEMGNSVKGFVAEVAKGAAKGAISMAGGYIPFVGGSLASYINSKFAVGGAVGVAPEVEAGQKTKAISTAVQLKALVKKFPEIAEKHGLSLEKIDEEAHEAKQISKAVGGVLKGHMHGSYDKSEIMPLLKLKPVKEKSELKKKVRESKKAELQPVDAEPMKQSKAVGGKVRSAAQLAATAKLVAANKARHAKK